MLIYYSKFDRDHILLYIRQEINILAHTFIKLHDFRFQMTCKISIAHSPFRRNGRLNMIGVKNRRDWVVTKFRKSTEILEKLLKPMSIASVMSTSVNYSLTLPPHATDKPTKVLLRESGPFLL